MNRIKDTTRRNAIKKIAGSAAVVAAGMSLSHRLSAAEAVLDEKLKGKINHSVCRWCYNEIPFEDLCKAANDIGITSIELIGPDEWPIAKKYGLTCAMPNGAGRGLEYGFNDLALHDELIKSYTDIIPNVAAAGLKQIICFSGNRRGLDDQKGIENCSIGLKRLMPIAEKYKIIVSMELLNSRVDHPDYQCDHSAWGIELCDKVGSDYLLLRRVSVSGLCATLLSLVFVTNKHVCFVATIDLHLLTSFYNLLFMCIMFVGELPAFLRATPTRERLRHIRLSLSLPFTIHYLYHHKFLCLILLCLPQSPRGG